MRTTAAPVGHLPWESRARPAAFVKGTTTLTDVVHLDALRAIVDRDQVDLWQPVPWTRQQSLAAEVGCAETDVSVLLDQIREERGIKPAWHRRYRKHEAKQGRLREARPFLKEKEKERTMAPKEAPLVRGTTEPAAEVTPAVEPVREKAIAEMTLDEVFRLVDPEITSRKRATIRVWEAMKVARVDPRKTISRDQQEAMLVPIGRLVAHNELSEIRAILRSLGWQDRFGHSKGEAFRAAKAPKSESNGRSQSSELAVPIEPIPEMLSEREVQALAAAQTWPDGGHLPVSPMTGAIRDLAAADIGMRKIIQAANVDVLQTEEDRLKDELEHACTISQEWKARQGTAVREGERLQSEIQRLNEEVQIVRRHRDEAVASTMTAEVKEVVQWANWICDSLGVEQISEASTEIERLQGQVERLTQENQGQERQMQHLATRCADAERRATELADLIHETQRQRDQAEIEAEVLRGQVQPQRPASLTLLLMELLEEITTQVCELRDEADKETVSASDCIAAMVSHFVRTARREVAA